MAITYEISIEQIFNARDRDDNFIGRPYTFVIKPYQRGYRWEPIHINHLIEDFIEFKQQVNENGKTIKKSYCLQPIITKAYNPEENEWELVDGQQRLISLWLMRRVCYWFRDDPDETDDSFYRFKFENKPELQSLIERISKKTEEPISSFRFLKELKEKEEAGDKDFLYQVFDADRGTNIDVDCVVECLRAILLFEKIKMSLISIFMSEGNEVSKAGSILLVWYELLSDKDSDDDAITVFSNINANKIKLTESELIKAQILYNLRGMEKKDEEGAKIAFRWEEIERDLCDDGFWYFLNAGDGKETGTRIDFLFEIWSKQDDEETLGCVNKQDLPEGWDKSDYPLSDLIENTLKKSKNKAETALEIWKKICTLLDTLRDWKNDYYFYHMMGLIIAVNKISGSKESAADIIKKIICEYKIISSKEDFKDYLKSVVRNQMYNTIDLKKAESRDFASFVDGFDDLDYGTSTSNIKIVLLMYNIASLINAKNEHERFPFELFFEDHYDIEHVNPQSPDEENEVALKEWYSALGIFDKYDESKSISEVLKEATQYAEEKKINNIGNLVLLDENTNRAYKNKSFFEKRREIINIIRTGKRKLATDIGVERYIPIGTKWVFLKAFSDLEDTEKASVHHIWDGEEEYRKDLVRQLWLLQSGLKKESGKMQYYEYKDGLKLSEGNLVMDEEGHYYFLKLNDNKDDTIVVTGEVEIQGVQTNGLVTDGKYMIEADGSITRIYDSQDQEGEV